MHPFSVLHRVAGHSLSDRVRSSVTQEELRVEPLFLHIEMSVGICIGCPLRRPPGHAGVNVTQLAWKYLGIPQKSWRKCPCSDTPLLPWINQKMDRQMSAIHLMKKGQIIF